ncbi:MAG: nucleotidyltransferase domain-containing protein [Rhodoferax sp.]|nr:nucleotidyltransferase domain-containing protein [Rhodoferax sp.]
MTPQAPPVDLTAQQQVQIERLLGLRLPHVTAVAFGSRVAGWPFGRGAKTYSDLDIALWGLRATDDKALAHLRADLEDSALPWRVDLSDANDLPTPLRELVERHGVLLQVAPVPNPAPA